MGWLGGKPKQVGSGRCGCGRSMPKGRASCPRCARTVAADTKKTAAPFPCVAQVWRGGKKQACGGTVRNGVCPSSDH